MFASVTFGLRMQACAFVPVPPSTFSSGTASSSTEVWPQAGEGGEGANRGRRGGGLALQEAASSPLPSCGISQPIQEAQSPPLKPVASDILMLFIKLAPKHLTCRIACLSPDTCPTAD